MKLNSILRKELITTIIKAVFLKSYKHNFECSVITLIFFSVLFLLLLQNLEVNDTILKIKNET